MEPGLTVNWRPVGSRFRVLVIAAGVLALLGVACGPAEEPTATSAPEPTATTEPTATAPPTATSASTTAEATATPEEEAAAAPTPTPGGPERGAVGERRQVTEEDIARIPEMTTQEFTNLFPAAYPRDYSLDEVKTGGTYRAAITWDISIWDTRKAAAGGTTSTANVVYERLVQFREATDGDAGIPEIVPDLAKSWEYNDDGTKLTLQLHEGMHWGDIDDPFKPGPEIVAEDIKWVIDEYRDESVQAGNYRSVKSVEAPSKYTVVLNFEGPSFFVLPFLASKDATMFNPYLARADRMKSEIVGPGPFIVTDTEKSQFVHLKRNPNHFMKDAQGNQLPYLDAVRFLITPEQVTRRALLRTGKVETAVSIVNTPRELQTLFKTNPDLQVFAVASDGASFHVSPQLNNPMFQDVNVRRALTLATDGKGIGDVVYAGMSMPVDKFEWWYWTDEQPLWGSDLEKLYGPYQNHFDLEKAKQLWEQGGLGDVTVRLPFYEYGAYIPDMLGILVDDWRKLGVDLKIQSQDYSDYNSTLQQSSHEQAIYSWQQQAYSAAGLAMTRVHSQGPGNRENVNDPKIDEWAKELTRTVDADKSRELMNKIRGRYNDQVYGVAMVTRALSFMNISQPYVRGMHAGEMYAISYYDQVHIVRRAWLDK